MAEKTVERRTQPGDWRTEPWRPFGDWWTETFRRMLDWGEIARPGFDEEHRMMRVEEFVEGQELVVRLEMPGIDPDKDVSVHVRDHMLDIRAERKETSEQKDKDSYRSEFRYGTFTRHLPLPVTADANDIKASCHWGILQVSIGLHDADEGSTGRRIPVQTTAP